MCTSEEPNEKYLCFMGNLWISMKSADFTMKSIFTSQTPTRKHWMLVYRKTTTPIFRKLATKIIILLKQVLPYNPYLALFRLGTYMRLMLKFLKIGIRGMYINHFFEEGFWRHHKVTNFYGLFEMNPSHGFSCLISEHASVLPSLPCELTDFSINTTFKHFGTTF